MVFALAYDEEKLNTKGVLSFPEWCVSDILLFVRSEDSSNASWPVLSAQSMISKNWG